MDRRARREMIRPRVGPYQAEIFIVPGKPVIRHHRYFSLAMLLRTVYDGGNIFPLECGIAK